LVLIGGLSAGAVTSCGPSDPAKGPISTSAVYTNNFYVPGVGYYHAPFRAWYHTPYNFYEPRSGQYFYGGQWAATPHQSITNISSPTPEVAQQAQTQRTDIPRDTGTSRGGFGSSSQHHSTWS
jgi:hypothetical protein